ncbi:MAG: hypothetical protein NWP83_04485, partial [Spirosomaceae bacterium]|nr:hypothetical protein [Spirosomataceae bacterium]
FKSNNFKFKTQTTMKKSIIFLLATISIPVVYAQDSKFEAAMKPLVAEIHATRFDQSLTDVSNKMERIAAAEPNEWLPNYYVAYCNIIGSLSEQDDDKKDLMLDKAEKYLEKAAKLSKNNDELEQLTAYFYNAKLAASPMTGWMRYGSKVEKHLENAKKLNLQNPRVALLEAESVYYTPSTFGGGKDKAKPMLEKAKKLFAEFTPKNELMPNWGAQTVGYYLSQY